MRGDRALCAEIIAKFCVTMRIKKQNKNEYIRTPQGMWVRNFTLSSSPCIDINESPSSGDISVMLQNEMSSEQMRIPWIDTEQFFHRAAVIVSDGYGFAKKHKVLETLPQDIAVFAVNGALKKWDCIRSVNYYVVNNPFRECLHYVPRRNNFPKCIASVRANSEFLSRYRGTKYRYAPSVNDSYAGGSHTEFTSRIDDYRNPICAAISLAYRFGVERILLLCCDTAFPNERPGAEKLPSGLWIYPEQIASYSLIDGMAHWLKKSPFGQIVVANHSEGPVYSNAVYIEEDNILSFLDFGVVNEKKE